MKTILTPARDVQLAALIEAERRLAALPEYDPDKRRWELQLALAGPLQLWVADGRDSRTCDRRRLRELCYAVGDALGGVVKMFEQEPDAQTKMAVALLAEIAIAVDEYFPSEEAIGEIADLRHQHSAGNA